MCKVQVGSEAEVVRRHRNIYMWTDGVYDVLRIHAESFLSNAHGKLGDGDKGRDIAQRCNPKAK